MSHLCAKHLLLSALVTASACVPSTVHSAAPDRAGPSVDVDPSALPPLWDVASTMSVRHGGRAKTTLAPFVANALPEDAAWEGFVTPASRGAGGLVAIEFHGKLVLQNVGIAGSVVSPYLATWDGTKFEPLPALTGSPYALGIWNDQLVVATNEYTTPQTIAVLRLNGAVWDTLGKPNNLVWKLTEWQGRLIAAGRFSSISGVAAPLVAAFDGVAWSAVGTGMSGTEVTGLAVHAGSLVAAARFGALKCVASLPALGGAWSTVGAGFTNDAYDVVSDGTYLYACGRLISSGATPMGCLARWDGSTWTSLTTSSIFSSEQHMVRWNGRIVVTFPPPVGTVGWLRQWDGVAFTSIPGDSIGFIGGGAVSRLATLGNNLIAMGTFASNGSTPVPSVATYDGVQWGTIGEPWKPTMTGPTLVYLTDLRAWSGKLIVGAPFSVFADQGHWVNAFGVAAWDGAHWSPLGAGLVGQYIWLAEYAGDLVAAGYDVSARGVPNSKVARWNGAAWSAVGNPAWSFNYVDALTQFQNDLYVAKQYESDPVWRWNGAVWSTVPGLADQYVYTLATVGPRLLVGGSFAQAGGIASPNVAFWNGSNWQGAGAGVNGYVQAATAWLGQPVIGGAFTASGATALSGVAIWDGSQWQPMGTRAVEVYRLGVVDGELFASGEFKLPDDSIVGTIAHWTGSDWHVLGSGSNSYAFAGYDGYLYQAGYGLVHGHPSHNLSRVPLSAVLDAPKPRPLSSHVALSMRSNPARGLARFSFSLPSAGRARLTVYDLGGRALATLADGPFDAGTFERAWTAPVAPGIYFIRLDTPAGHASQRFVFLGP